MSTLQVTFTSSLHRLPNGDWVCDIVASSGESHSERFPAHGRVAADRRVRELLQILKLRAELQDMREQGNRLVLDPLPLIGNGSGGLEPYSRALDTADCFGDMPTRMSKFRSGCDGTGAQRRRRSDAKKLNVSPWLRAHSKRDLTFIRKLARAFPELPWADELR